MTSSSTNPSYNSHPYTDKARQRHKEVLQVATSLQPKFQTHQLEHQDLQVVAKERLQLAKEVKPICKLRNIHHCHNIHLS